MLVSCGKSASKGGNPAKEIKPQIQIPRKRDNHFTVQVRINNRSFFVRKGASKTVEQEDRRQCSFGIERGRYQYEIEGKKIILRSGPFQWELNSATIYERNLITGSWRGDIYVGGQRVDVTLRFIGEELTVVFNCR